MAKNLRFAPLIRVSAEKQEKQGESLNTQKAQITDYVKALDGVIPSNCWRYSGQEHATPDQERKNLENLLDDSSKGIFDAVMVCDASRWSRDNRKSKEGLEILKANDIKFFIGTMEIDLYSPEQTLFLGMATEMNEFMAKAQSQKSLLNRIARAKRGIPTGGRLPFARTFDKETGLWGIDEEKKKSLEWAAEQYLKGESMEKMAKAIGLNHSNLWKVLKYRSGDTWKLEFNKPDLKIHEIVEMKIPRLLPDETIEAIHKRTKSNITYTHGKIVNEYMLSRCVFCAHCGYAMTGQMNDSGTRYHRHSRGRKIKCDHPRLNIKADPLEDAVLFSLFKLFGGDVANIKKAIERAIPNKAQLEKKRKKMKTLGKQLLKAEGQKQRIVKAIKKGIISDDDAEKEMDETKEGITILRDEIDKLGLEIKDLPDPATIKRKASLIKRQTRQYYTSPMRIKKMPFEARRELVQRAFAGEDKQGRRLGVYVSRDKKGKVHYEIRGILPFDEKTMKGQLPMTRQQAFDQFGLDGVDFFDEIEADGFDDSGPYYADPTENGEIMDNDSVVLDLHSRHYVNSIPME